MSTSGARHEVTHLAYVAGYDWDENRYLELSMNVVLPLFPLQLGSTTTFLMYTLTCLPPLIVVVSTEATGRVLSVLSRNVKTLDLYSKRTTPPAPAS